MALVPWFQEFSFIHLSKVKCFMLPGSFTNEESKIKTAYNNYILLKKKVTNRIRTNFIMPSLNSGMSNLGPRDQMSHALAMHTPSLAKVKQVVMHHVMMCCREFDMPDLVYQKR